MRVGRRCDLNAAIHKADTRSDEGIDHRLYVAVGRSALAAFEISDCRYTQLRSLSQLLLVPGEKGASRLAVHGSQRWSHSVQMGHIIYMIYYNNYDCRNFRIEF